MGEGRVLMRENRAITSSTVNADTIVFTAWDWSRPRWRRTAKGVAWFCDTLCIVTLHWTRLNAFVGCWWLDGPLRRPYCWAHDVLDRDRVKKLEEA